MPYGVVMASGGAAAGATLLGWHGLALTLTGIAAFQALFIAFREGFRRGDRRRWGFGLFTIALGLAVLAENLYPFVPRVGGAVLVLALLATALLGLLSVRARGGGGVDGTWFLAPAALLGDAAAMAEAGWSADLAIALCVSGVAGYGLVLGLAGWRLGHEGLRGAPLSPWWISAGCGGLAAAALGKVAEAASPGRVRAALNALVLPTWAIGTILLFAVLVGCTHHAACRPRGRWNTLWTPVFSMAVYAQGTDRYAHMSADPVLFALAAASLLATLALWAINSGLFLFARFRRPS